MMQKIGVASETTLDPFPYDMMSRSKGHFPFVLARKGKMTWGPPNTEQKRISLEIRGMRGVCRIAGAACSEAIRDIN